MNLSRIKNVIVLYGPKDSCKTSILRDLCAKLIRKPSAKKPLIKKVGKRKEIGSPYRRDVCVMCEYYGRIVAVCTGGDSADIVLKNFMWMDASVLSGCNIGVAFIAIRKQRRRDGIGKQCKSMPLLELEELEEQHHLNVIRPFIVTGKTIKGMTSAQIQQQKTLALQQLEAVLFNAHVCSDKR